MSRNAKSLVLLMACVLFGALTATAGTFYVEPGGTSPNFPSLTSAVTTIGAYAGTDHVIVVKAGNYTDANISVPANIAEIYGEDKATVIFTAPLATDKFLMTGAAQSGFKLHDMTITGYERAIENSGGSGHTYSNLICSGGNWGIVLFSAGGNTITGNCFVGNAQSPQVYDDGATSAWSGNFFSDAPTTGSYCFAPACSNWDPTPQLLTNFVEVASPQEIGSTVDVDIEWNVPACDASKLAAYEFTVTYDPTKLDLVSADFDEEYLGAPPAALYVKTIDETLGTVLMTGANFSAPGEGSHRLAFLKFTAIATGSVTIGLASQYRDELGNPLVVAETPETITIQDTQAPVLDPLVPIDPLGFATFSDGSVAGSELKYKLYMQFTAHDNYGLLRIQYSWNGTSWSNLVAASGLTWTNAPGQQYINLTSRPEATGQTLYIRALDLSNNPSNVHTYGFGIDRTGPVLTSITLSDNDGCAPNPEFTNESTVKVAYVASGLGPGTPTQQFYVDGGPWLPASPAPFLAYPQATVSLGVTPSQGSHIVYSRIFDVFNNMGNQTSDNIMFDNVAPALSSPLSLGSWPPPGQAKTNVLSVLGYFLSWDADRMQAKVSEDGSVFTNCGGWGAITYPVPVTLSSGDATKTVYYAIRDSAGNVSAVISDQIVLDQTAPDLSSVTISDVSDGGTDCTNAWPNVTVTFAATDAVYLTLDDGGAATTYGDGVTILTSPYTVFYSGTGSYGPAPTPLTINAKLTDNAGNVGAVMPDVITVDWQNPTLTGMDIADAAATAAPVYPALGEGPASVSNSKTVNLTLTGLPTDATELWVSEDGFVADSAMVALSSPTDPVTVSYLYRGAGTECAYNTLTARARDCAGNPSPVAVDAVYFDFTAPTLTSIAGPATTNNLLVSLTLTASDNCYLYIMRLSEDPSFTGVPWVAYTATPSFTLAAGDGLHTIYVQIADYTGNMASGSHAVTLDQTAPSGTAVLQKAAPVGNTLPGWTNTRTLNEIANIVASGGAVNMYIDNVEAGGSVPFYGPVAASYGPWALGTGADGLRTVRIYFQDGVGNWSPAIPLTIMLDRSAPSAPAAATGTPTGSIQLSWTAVPQAQFYPIRYNFSGDYPLYDVPNPPAPNDVQGFSGGNPTSNSMDFEGPQPDMYHFSIWTMDSAGNKSAAYNTDVLQVNYILGDFLAAPGPDGCIDFVNEFFRLAGAYTLISTDPGFEDSLDIGPTTTGMGDGIPMTDDAIDFEDLVIFALNYDVYHCSFGSTSTERPNDVPSPASVSKIDLIAEMPNAVRSGSEYTVILRAEDMSDVKAYHLGLNYDRNLLDLVKVEAGGIHQSVDKQWFFVDKKKSNIDITGVVLEGQFNGDEVARLTFKAKGDGVISLTDEKLDLRDRTNTQIEATLSLSRGADALPAEFALSQNYPNPFNPTTTIELALPVASDYSLTIYNIAGQVVETFAGHADAGYLKVNWNAQRLASGIYLYKMIAGSYTDTKKMVLLK